MESAKLWLLLKDIFIAIIQYGFPIVALTLSILSYRNSREANKVQDRLNQVEEKLKKYELEEKEKEREEATKACVEARIMYISKGKYRMKIWNSGKATAYNVDFKISEGYEVIIWREKVPYEYLESGKSFEEHVLVHGGTPNKFQVVTTWKDEDEIEYSKKQMVTI